MRVHEKLSRNAVWQGDNDMGGLSMLDVMTLAGGVLDELIIRGTVSSQSSNMHVCLQWPKDVVLRISAYSRS